MRSLGTFKMHWIYSYSFLDFHGEPEVVIMWKLSKETKVILCPCAVWGSWKLYKCPGVSPWGYKGPGLMRTVYVTGKTSNFTASQDTTNPGF